VGGFFIFYAPRGPHQNSSSYQDFKGGSIVSDKIETTEVARKAAGLGISLDAWAVALALGLALLVWIGWIKHVPW
jgi:hypothetical protein